MKVSDMIEWLKTMPQDAVVQVLDHHSGNGYYDQGGHCYLEYFTTHVDEYSQGVDSKGFKWIYGDHFELNEYNGVQLLQLGVKDK